MKLECIKDVIMNGTDKIELFSGKVYEGFIYKENIHVRNDSGYRHEVKLLGSDRLDEFFNEHFREVEYPSLWEVARLLLPLSRCKKRQYACVIANDGVIIATGYNQSLTACTTCVRMNVEHNTGSYDDCPAVHAEASALINAPQELLQGAELYLVCADEVNPIPCPTCQKLLDWAGVKRVREVQE